MPFETFAGVCLWRAASDNELPCLGRLARTDGGACQKLAVVKESSQRYPHTRTYTVPPYLVSNIALIPVRPPKPGVGAGPILGERRGEAGIVAWYLELRGTTQAAGVMQQPQLMSNR